MAGNYAAGGTASDEDDDAGTRRTTPKVVSDALAFQKQSAECFFAQRQREEDDLAFQVPDKQWPDEVKAQRGGQTVNGIPLPARPMLSIPILDQPIQLQVNQFVNAHLGVNVHPLSEDADEQTAEVIQGLYRHIEQRSRADIARTWAFDRGVKCGWGCYRVNTPYDEDSDDPRDLTISIDRILHQSSVFPDPFAQQPDFSDGRRALIASYMDYDVFKREYPKASLNDYGDDEIAQLATDYPFWINGTSESRAVCVAEYFEIRHRKREWVIAPGGKFVFRDELTTPVAAQTIKTVDWPELYWAKVNACEVLEGNDDKTDARKMNGRYIPIVFYPARELQPFKGERIWSGMIGPNKDAARLVNYELSNAVEKDALSPKAPYIGAVGQFKTMRKQWDQANVRNFSTLEYDPVPAGNTLAPPPQRNMVGADLSSAIALVQLAKDAVQMGTSTTDAAALENLAKKRVAKDTIAGIANQGDASNSHFIATFAGVTQTREAAIVLDLIRIIFDRPGRIAQVLGMDNKRSLVMVNAPFTMDPRTKRPVAAQPGAPKVKQFNLTQGKYGYVVEIGKSYKSRMQEGSDAFGQLLTGNPELIAILGDLWMQFQDFPGHTEAAKRLKAMLPPPIKALDADEGQMDPAEQLAAAQQQIAQMEQALQQMQRDIETDKAKQQATLEKAGIDNSTRYQIALLDADTSIRIEGMKATIAKAKTLAELEKQRQQAIADAVTREDEQRHEMSLKVADAGHEERLAIRAAQEAERAADRAHEQGKESAELAHEQGKESAEHAAALEPKEPSDE